MSTTIPSASDVTQRLKLLDNQQLRALSEKTGAPFTTLWKIRSGVTEDPRIETVRLIWPELDSAEGVSGVQTPAAAA